MELREFKSSFTSYVDGDNDSRRSFANSLVRESAVRVMAMSAEDLAAILSFAVAGSLAPPVKSKLRDFDDDDPEQVAEMEALLRRYPPELIVDPRHPAITSMLEQIKGVDGGLVYTAKVAVCLAHGRTLKSLAPRMYNPSKTKES